MKGKILLFITIMGMSFSAMSQDYEYLDRYKKNNNLKFGIVTCQDFKDEKKYNPLIIDIRNEYQAKFYGKLPKSINIQAYLQNESVNVNFLRQLAPYFQLKEEILLVSHDGTQALMAAEYFDQNNIYPKEKIKILFGGVIKWIADGCKLENGNGKSFNN
jgi:rhodanese-related sulfurtransferase